MDLDRMVNVVKKAIEIGAELLEVGKDIGPIAREIVVTIGKTPDEVTDEDLDRLAAASDAAHEEVQRAIPDDV